MRFRLLVLLVFSYSIVCSQQNKLNSKTVGDFNNKLYSYLYVSGLQSIINESNFLISNWVYIEKQPNTPKKLRLIKIYSELLPQKLNQLDYLATFWTFAEKEMYQEIKNEIIKLKEHHEYIMSQLSNFKSYDNIMVLFEVTPMVEEGSETLKIFDDIKMKLDVFGKNYYNQFNTYLPPLSINENIQVAEIDPKMILIEMFISKFKLEEFVKGELDYKKIYDTYSLKELKLALSDDLKDDSDFYAKYNNLVIELSK